MDDIFNQDQEHKGIPMDYLTRYVYNRIHPGDIVMIPEKLNDGMECFAKVERIYPHFVLFRTKRGLSVTALYIDAAFLHVVQPSDYKKYDEFRDLVDAFSNL